MKSVKRPSASRGAVKARLLTETRPLEPMLSTGSAWPSGRRIPVSKPKRLVIAAARMNPTSPAWVRSVNSLAFWLRSP